MLEAPQRESIVQRVAGILESAIRRQEWRQKLPSERLLCSQLHVSRETIGYALNILERKGIIRSIPRIGHVIQKRHLCAGRQHSKTIHVLLRRPPENLSDWGRLFYDEVGRIISGAGYELRFHTLAHERDKTLAQRLARMVKNEQAACWAIHSAARETQQWFCAHHVPTLVIGHCYSGIALPAIDDDSRATCRHAVTLLLRLGHRLIVLLVSRRRYAGDWYCEQGFRDGFTQMARPDARFEVLYHNLDADSIRAIIRKRWGGKAYPTALVVSQAEHAITAASGLMELGLRLARDVSLICHEGSEILNLFTPPITHYAISRAVFSRRVAQMLLELAQTGCLKRSMLMIPELNKGGTLGSAPR